MSSTPLPPAFQKLAVDSSKVKTAIVHDRVYNQECVYTFHSPFTTPKGIVVNLATFVGTIESLALSNDQEEALFVRIVKERVPKAPEDAKEDNTATTAAPTKLGIGVEGGFASEADKYDIVSTYSIVHLKKKTNDDNQVEVVTDIPYENATKEDQFPMLLVQSVDSIVQHSGASLQQDVQTWQLEQDDLKVSKYANDLPFVDNGVQISPNPKDWKCQKSGNDQENGVWLNLSDGYMGGGRQHWDGSGGSNGALDHYNETGKQYPLVVKLGTITSDIKTADCYSYAEDEDGPVLVPNLAELLAKRGINIANLNKTVKSTAELEVELNANYAFDAITETGSKLQPVSGPNQQGLQNLGNSCYLNSVVQLLSHMPEWKARYGTLGSTNTVAPTSAPLDLLTQTTKLTSALVSGEFSKPQLSSATVTAMDTSSDDGASPPQKLDSDQDDPEATNPKYRLAPRMFKHVVGKDHVDFKTGQQQDAAQFLQYYLELMDRAEQKQWAKNKSGKDDAFYPSSHLVSFATETRSVCSADQKIKYDSNTSQRETIWSLAIPMELATAPQTEPDSKRHKTTTGTGTTTADNDTGSSHSTEATASTESPEEPVPQIDLTTCLDRWAAETTVEDIAWPHLQGAKHAAVRTTKLVNFPKFLLVQLQRYTLDQAWQPVKLQVELQIPTNENGAFVVDLTKYKSLGGPQPNEVLVPASAEDAGTAAAASASAPTIDEAALSQLMDMGFSLNACKRALTAVGGNNVEAAMGWVFEHNNDPDFNDPMPEDDSSKAAAAAGPASSSGVDEATVQSLVEMLGCFTADQVRFALQETNGASDRAADWLFSHMEDVDALMIAAAETKQAASNDVSGTGTASTLPPLDDSTEGTYQLKGMISHIGKHTGSGHYVAHLLLEDDDKKPRWVIFNDEKVALSEKPPVEHAYLYLFQRTDTLKEGTQE